MREEKGRETASGAATGASTGAARGALTDTTSDTDIAADVAACTWCGLAEGRHRPVPGEGPSDARIMLIGEAPGAEEDLTGRPFVGRAGAILDRALAAAGIKRSEVFITSVIKCRPPQNRKPRKAEVEKCMPYLRRQISEIKPKVVILMGNVATDAVLGLHGVTDLRGRVFEEKYLVTYHPAAILRNRELMDDFISDLKKARERSGGSGVK